MFYDFLPVMFNCDLRPVYHQSKILHEGNLLVIALDDGANQNI